MAGLAAAAITIPSVLMIPDGLAWRLDKDALEFRFLNSRVSQDIRGSLGCPHPCVFGNQNGKNVLVFGESPRRSLHQDVGENGRRRLRLPLCRLPELLQRRHHHQRLDLSAACAGLREARLWLLEWVKSKKFVGAIVGQRWLSYTKSLTRGGENLRAKEQGSDSERAASAATMLNDVGALLQNAVAGPVIVRDGRPRQTGNVSLRPAYLPMRCPSKIDGYGRFPEVVASFAASSPLQVHFVNVRQIHLPGRAMHGC